METIVRHRILAIDDEPAMLKWFETVLQDAGYEVRAATRGAIAEELCRTWDPAVIISDLVLPDVDGLELLRRFKRDRPEAEVLLVTGHASVQKAVEAMRSGAFHFVEKPVDPGALLATLDRAIEKRALQLENRKLRRELDGRFTFHDIVGRSRRMQEILSLLQRVAPTDASVLIVGESGTGKELVANAIHANSARGQAPFMKINCSAIPKDLIESELFGYRKGAFTGALTDRGGLLKAAHGGSLLLDEIAEMPTHLQTRLLRVLQEREYRPLGSNRTERVDFRLISATNVDVESALKEGKLRDDLYFRINTIMIRVPPLRERPEDIPLLCQHFLEKCRQRHGRHITGIAPAAYEALLHYDWPGNVRELEHALERGVLVAAAEEIQISDLPEPLGQEARGAPAQQALPSLTLEELERMAIEQALQRTGGNKQEAAQLLGLYRQTLYSKIKKYGLDVRKAAIDARQSVGEAQPV